MKTISDYRVWSSQHSDPWSSSTLLKKYLGRRCQQEVFPIDAETDRHVRPEILLKNNGSAALKLTDTLNLLETHLEP